MTDLYQEIILEEYRHPQNMGVLENADRKEHEVNASCGDEVTVYLKLNPEKDRIIDLKWQGKGCVISMAAMSLLSERAKTTNVADIQKMTKQNIETMSGITEISYGREKCLLLGLQTLKKALSNLA